MTLRLSPELFRLKCLLNDVSDRCACAEWALLQARSMWGPSWYSRKYESAEFRHRKTIVTIEIHQHATGAIISVDWKFVVLVNRRRNTAFVSVISQKAKTYKSRARSTRTPHSQNFLNVKVRGPFPLKSIRKIARGILPLNISLIESLVSCIVLCIPLVRRVQNAASSRAQSVFHVWNFAFSTSTCKDPVWARNKRQTWKQRPVSNWANWVLTLFHIWSLSRIDAELLLVYQWISIIVVEPWHTAHLLDELSTLCYDFNVLAGLKLLTSVIEVSDTATSHQEVSVVHLQSCWLKKPFSQGLLHFSMSHFVLWEFLSNSMWCLTNSVGFSHILKSLWFWKVQERFHVKH